jgi:hypothetical protein
MKKVLVSVNGKKPFETRKKEDLENLLEQMFAIKNRFRSLPNCSFSVSAAKTILIDWTCLNSLTEEARHGNTVHLNQLIDKLLERIS